MKKKHAEIIVSTWNIKQEYNEGLKNANPKLAEAYEALLLLSLSDEHTKDETK